MPEQKDIVLIGRGTLGYAVCLWATLCNLGKNPLTQTYHLCSVTSPADPGQDGPDEGLIQTESRICTLKGGVLHLPKNGKRLCLYAKEKTKRIFSKVEESAHSVSLQEKHCPRPPHTSCIYLIPNSSHEHCFWLSIAQQAPPAWPAPNEHPAPFGCLVDMKFQV